MKPLVNDHSIPLKSSNLKVAGILDELSEHFFPYECEFLNLDAGNWQEQIESFSPHFLFVESIWNGFNSTWRRKLTPEPLIDFINLVKWCKKNQVPTVFWNKEDPIHFNTFFHVASYFDYVLTTDFDCIPLYKQLLRHEQVYFMPFASCVQIYSPIEKYNRKDAACFAGSYYNRQEERKKDFEGIMDLLTERGMVEIYDRNPYPDDPDYNYPDKYKKFIIGTLPPDKIDIAYKSYKIGVTLNIVKRSSTMEARRAFELISCNTLVLSNECQGLKNLFGDLVVYFDKTNKCAERLDQLFENSLLLDKTRLMALRKVLTEHTYRERIDFLYKLIFQSDPEDRSPKIAVYGIVQSTEDVELIMANYNKQTYKFKSLFLFSENRDMMLKNIELPNDIEILSLEQMTPSFLENFDFCSFFSHKNYYGPNYLTDLALSLKYESPTAIGKGCYYSYGEIGFKMNFESKKYVLITSLQIDRALVSVDYKREIGFFGLEEGERSIDEVPCLSIDPFNFCEGYTYENCKMVDDIIIDTGISMEELNDLSMNIKPEEDYFAIPLSIQGDHLFNITRTDPRDVGKIKTIDDSVGLYTIGSKNNLNMSQVYLQRKFLVKDFSDSKGIITIHLDALMEGSAKMLCSFYDSKDQYLGRYHILNNSCTMVRNKEGAAYFKLHIEMEGTAQIILRTVALNPQPYSSIIDTRMVEGGGN